MRTIIVGYGNQGKKREPLVDHLVDMVDVSANRTVFDVALDSYDAALVCTPNEPKLKIVTYLLMNGKHVLVEKPLWPANADEIAELDVLAKGEQLVLYTAYNHRFEPAIRLLTNVLQQQLAGPVYHCRMFYGNGTAALVKNSWRDQLRLGVLPEVGAHLFDLAYLWFGNALQFEMVSLHRYENKMPDHAVVIAPEPVVELEMSYLSWKNTFTIDIICQNGSFHIDGLCKWGRSTFVERWRTFPAGAPREIITTFVESDTTWGQEFLHFQDLVKSRQTCSLESDILMARTFHRFEETIDADRIHRDDASGRDPDAGEPDSRILH